MLSLDILCAGNNRKALDNAARPGLIGFRSRSVQVIGDRPFLSLTLAGSNSKGTARLRPLQTTW